MGSTTTSPAVNRRRSQRIPLVVPLVVSGRDPISHFSERCQTLAVSAHGSAIRASIPLKPRSSVRLEIPGYRSATGHVVRCDAVGPDTKVWHLMVELDAPGNFWGVKLPPEDWPLVKPGQVRRSMPLSSRAPSPGHAAAATEARVETPPAPPNIVEAQLGKLRDALRELMLVSRDQVLKQSREELRGLVAGVRQQFSQESKQYAAICAKMEAQLDEVQKIRDGVESAQRSLPQAIDQNLEKSVAAVIERLQTRVEEGIAAQAQRHTEQLNRQLVKLDAQAGEAAREKLREELERHQAQFLDQIDKRMEEARTVEGSVRQQADQTLARLSAQLDNFVTRRQQELSAQLEQQGRELLEAATRVVPKMEEQIGTGLLERLRADLDQRRTQLQQSPEVTGAETAPVQEPTVKVQEGGDQATSTPDVLVRRREPKQDVREVQKAAPQEAVRPDYVKVASTDEIAPDQGKVVEVDGKKVLLFNIDGKFFALGNTCPHRGGPLSAGEWEGDEVTCPWHGSKFKITTGEVLCPPATQGVKSFPVRITGKDLEVKIE